MNVNNVFRFQAINNILEFHLFTFKIIYCDQFHNVLVSKFLLQVKMLFSLFYTFDIYFTTKKMAKYKPGKTKTDVCLYKKCHIFRTKLCRYDKKINNNYLL